MAGFYFHIPFCKTKCPYCDFYSITNFSNSIQSSFINLLKKEIELRVDFLTDRKVETIYFGGGTPSTLHPKYIQSLIDFLSNFFHLSDQIEITIEINPDDLTFDYAKQLKEFTIVNRLSIGIQSFIDEELKFLKRRHTAKQCYSAIEVAKKVGYSNISIDLIFGIPNSSLTNWQFNLKQFLKFDLPHISTYNLTIEPETAFYSQLIAGKLKLLDEQLTNEMYLIAIDVLEAAGYRHYEVSNFAKPNFYSRHNWIYWTDKQYIGYGPSAHSYNGSKRCWNVADLHHYMKVLRDNKLPIECELLSDKDKFNEYILTHLRIDEGLDLEFIKTKWKSYYAQIEKTLDIYLKKGWLRKENNRLKLTRQGYLWTDLITRELFV